jgi:monoamine oxidase
MPTPSFRAQWAQRLVREKLSKQVNYHNDNDSGFFDLPKAVVPWTPLHLPQDKKLPKVDFDPGTKVCITGAGAAGLYIAMILDDLAIPNLSYDILEAEDRIGGRMKTHYFSQTRHDYYDIGAMRFPKITIMDRTFDLFRRTGVPLVPYYLDKSTGAKNNPSLYNDRLLPRNSDDVDPTDVDPDPYHVSEANGGSIPDATVAQGTGILDLAFKEFKDAMQNDFEKGFKRLLEQDSYSTREYLRLVGTPDKDSKSETDNKDGKNEDDVKNVKRTTYDFYSIQWLETLDTSSGLFDQAFSESVIDSFDFDNPNPSGHVSWFCVDGGTSLVAQRMSQTIKGMITTNKRVTSISIDRTLNSDKAGDNTPNMIVKVAGETIPRKPYATVFNTTSLSCLQRIDVTDLELMPTQKDAIRCLHYDDSAKVAIRFKRPWWITDCDITQGGTANTDLPLRTCVYPSYNLDDGAEHPAVLLCCYVWAQDANRIGSLIRDDKQQGGEVELLELMFRDLAALHHPYITYEKIKKEYDTHHAFSWSHDPYTSGAFALFGPGQFANFFPYLSMPTADSKFHSEFNPPRP